MPTAAPDSPTLPQFSVSLDAETVDALAVAVARRVAELLPEPAEDGWLDSRGMADYLGVPLSMIRTMTARGELPTYQDREGGNHYGKRSELDEWRRSNLPAR
ncbi:MAG TPA: helix-turn-helix domain-containing protein [Solirubrobacterales bacterium]|nr:helix-turn-helix domain-containing protein [Solirubrobacterales bacterium]